MTWLRVTDGAFPPGDILDAVNAWPRPNWPYWFRYDSPLERKSTCQDWSHIPFPIFHLLTKMLTRPPRLDAGPIIGDSSLHGGGMHDMSTGDLLTCHLDADRHPAFGWERRYNAILFLSAWKDNWQGCLEIWKPNLRERETVVIPALNRLVVFETTPYSYNAVSGPISCPPEIHCKSLAVYWWGPPRGVFRRPRAQFVALAHEPPNAELAKLRRERCQLPDIKE